MFIHMNIKLAIAFLRIFVSKALIGVPGACGINSNSTRKIWKYE